MKTRIFLFILFALAVFSACGPPEGFPEEADGAPTASECGETSATGTEEVAQATRRLANAIESLPARRQAKIEKVKAGLSRSEWRSLSLSFNELTRTERRLTLERLSVLSRAQLESMVDEVTAQQTDEGDNGACPESTGPVATAPTSTPPPPPSSGGGGSGGGGSGPPPPPSFSTTNGRIVFDRGGQVFTMNPDGTDPQFVGYGSDAAWSPDGTKIVFFQSGAQTDLIVVNADGSSPVNITNDAAQDFQPTWGQNNRIAFTSNSDGDFEIYSVAADGTDRLQLTTNTFNDVEPSWGPNGTKLAFRSDQDGNDEIYLMNADGSGVVRLTNDPARDHQPDISPDGAKVAFTSDREDAAPATCSTATCNWEVFVMNSDGTNVVRLTTTTGRDAAPSWSPDGTKLVFHSQRDGNREIYSMNADGSAQTRLTFDAATDQFPDWGNRAVTIPPPPPPVVATNGKIAVERDGMIITMDPDGTDEKVVTPGSEPAWSPDGSSIVYRLFDATTFDDLWVIPIAADGSAGGSPQQLTSAPGSDYEPEWSKDGTKIVFYSDRPTASASGDFEIFWLDITGSAPPTQVTDNAVPDYNPSWNQDASKIVYQQFGTPSQIYVVNANGSGAVNISNTTADEHDPEWSWDGTKIVFASERNVNFDIYSMNPDGSSQTQLTTHSANDYQPTWSPEGTHIAFISERVDPAPTTCGPCLQGLYVMGVNPSTAPNLIEAITSTTSYLSSPHWGTHAVTP